MTQPDPDLRDRIAEALLDHLSRTADIRPGRDGQLAFMPEVTDTERLRIAEHLASKLAELREKYTAGLRRADEINNQLMEEVQRYADGKERPVLWSVYNQMHKRALDAEAEVEQLRRLAGEAQQDEAVQP